MCARHKVAGGGNALLRPPGSRKWKLEALQLLVKRASRTRNINPARYVALAVLHALDDPRRLAALGTIRALARVHHLLTVRRFCDLRAYCHGSFLLMFRCVRSVIHSILPADVVDGMFQKVQPESSARKPQSTLEDFYR
jgi:hypothetical protein